MTKKLFPAPPVWFKSSRSNLNQECLEIAIGELIMVRDSKSPTTKLTFSHARWGEFVAAIRMGEFDN